MKTITFYSYKGGVGRTLVLANIARYLSMFGKRVFVLDLDLEAPGLHYKLTPHGGIDMITAGIVDYIHDAIQHRASNLSTYTVNLGESNSTGGTIQMMPAGHVSSKNYWHRLSQIDWHKLVFGEEAQGIPLFLELKEQIQSTYSPDYLLIDARTGITEVGGIATTLLADQVVCLLASNRENLEGARAVLRSIKKAPRIEGAQAIDILPVLARIPSDQSPQLEQEIAATTLSFLNASAQRIDDTLKFEKLFILHSEPELQISEAIRVGKKAPDESPLLRDYLRLFSELIPDQEIESQLGPLIQGAFKRAIDDPEGAQREMEVLAEMRPHAESYRALVKFYRLRREDENRLLGAAFQLWRLTNNAKDSLLWEVIKSHSAPFHSFKKTDWTPGFIDNIWTAFGGTDEQVGLKLARFYIVLNRRAKALEILRRILLHHGASLDVTVECLDLLIGMDRQKEALLLAEESKSQFSSNPQFQAAWAKATLAMRGDEALKRTILDPEFRLEQVMQADESVWAYLTVFARSIESMRPKIDDMLRETINSRGPAPVLIRLGDIYHAQGKWNDFEKLVQEFMPTSEAIEFANYAERRIRTRAKRGE